MGWFSKRKVNEDSKTEKTEYYEKDNVGTRFYSGDKAGAYLLYADTNEPRIDYFFKSESDARAAILQVPCIKLAKDSNNLISIKILQFGVFKRYENSNNVFIALLAGKGLTHDVWVAAKKSFENHGGEKIAEVEPPQESHDSERAVGNATTVVFSHEENRIVSGFPATYRYYDAPDKASAIAFLQNNPVKQGSFFLVVKTHEGIFCRDIQGFFEQ